jgi:hypothetical protein
MPSGRLSGSRRSTWSAVERAATSLGLADFAAVALGGGGRAGDLRAGGGDLGGAARAGSASASASASDGGGSRAGAGSADSSASAGTDVIDGGGGVGAFVGAVRGESSPLEGGSTLSKEEVEDAGTSSPFDERPEGGLEGTFSSVDSRAASSTAEDVQICSGRGLSTIATDMVRPASFVRSNMSALSVEAAEANSTYPTLSTIVQREICGTEGERERERERDYVWIWLGRKD